MGLADWTTRFLVGGERDKAPKADRSEPTLGDAGPGLVGTRVGAYQITKRIGAGGVGEVYKGVDVMLKREVAIKWLRDELAAAPVFLARFRNEAQLQAKLSHPNVASVHAFFQEGDKQFLVMEYVPGIALDEFVRSGGPVPVERALDIFRRALDGIAHAHAHGIVHRDIKPANIMLADNGQVKVMDFGIARAMDSQERLTRFGHVAGTAKAMSPEQIRGQAADVRSDIYSLGIVLYTLLAGRAPFDAKDDLALMKAQVEQPPLPLRGLVDDLPAKVEAAVMKALQKDPADRFQTVREFSSVIEACRDELAIRLPPVPDRALDAPTLSRTAINPALQGVKQLPAAAPKTLPAWARLGAVALVLAGLGGAAVWLWPTALPPAEPPSAGPVKPAPAPVPAAETVSAKPVDVAPATQAAPVAAAPVAPAPVALPPRSLAIVRLTAEGKADPAGAANTPAQFRPGERIRLLIAPSHEAYVYCYLQDQTRSIVRFYPNRFSAGSLVSPATPLEIPGRMGFELVADSLKAEETVACFASERDVTTELPASVYGMDFARLPAASLEEVSQAFARVSAGNLTEARFRIDVR